MEPMTPRALEDDLKRLETQLTTLDPDAVSSLGSRSSVRRQRRRKIQVVVPPGKLGVVLANRNDGKGTVVSEVRTESSILGMLSPGDKLVAVDGEDVTGMVVSEITTMMALRSSQERRLTLLTSHRKGIVRPSEAKVDENV